MKTINGWTLTGAKIWKTNLEAKHTCGRVSGFGSVPEFIKNNKKCRDCTRRDEISEAMHYHFNSYVYQAKKRGYAFNLKYWEFELMASDLCYYCGTTGTYIRKGLPFAFVGIDRIDNDKGYTMDNIRACCRTCNVAKGTMTEQEFIERIKRWYEKMIK